MKNCIEKGIVESFYFKLKIACFKKVELYTS